VVAHMFLCPQCAATKEIDEVHDLELVDVEIEE
jgi:glutaredoxin